MLKVEEINEIRKTIEASIGKNAYKIAEILSAELTEYINYSKAEQLCTVLQCAIVSCSLMCPDITEFEKYLSQINNAKHFSDIMERLRRLKMLIDPFLMFDRQPKHGVSEVELIESGFNRYVDGHKSTIEDMDKNKPIPMYLEHFKRLKTELHADFEAYFKELANISKSLSKIHGITIDDNFSIINGFYTTYSREKLEKVFDLLVQEGYIGGGREEKSTFTSMFNISVFAPERRITIIKKGKNKDYNVAWLHNLFTKLLSKDQLSEDDKKRIVNFFVIPKDEIQPSSIKTRKSNSLRKFRDTLDEILD